MPRLLELFSGTGSIGKPFKACGWEVVSLDLREDFQPTIVADIMNWDHTMFPSGHFEIVWASPVCTHYSCARTTGKTPRDLDAADALVQRVLDIISYYCPVIWAFENPYTGLLKTRDVVKDVPYKVITYCKYGFEYRKATAIWTNLGDLWQPRPVCTKKDHCEYIVDGKHPLSAQRAPAKINGVRRTGDRCTLEQLYSMPPQLCEEFCAVSCAVIEGHASH